MEIKCTQCGGKAPIEEDADFIRCPFCETALYIDADRSVKHFYMDPVVNEKDLGPLIQRRLSYMEIQSPVTVQTSRVILFPFWRFDSAIGGSLMIPAAMPPIEDMTQVKNPAGDLKLYSDDLSKRYQVVEPELLLDDALVEAQRVLGTKDPVKFTGASMTHLPLIEVRYLCKEGEFGAVVEAVSGEVHADDWPAAPVREKDRALGLIALAAFVLFLAEAALVPWAIFLIPIYAITALGIYAFARNKLHRMGW